jgi:hypothetical protein
MFLQITRSVSSHSNTQKSKSQLQTSVKAHVEFSVLFWSSVKLKYVGFNLCNYELYLYTQLLPCSNTLCLGYKKSIS